MCEYLPSSCPLRPGLNEYARLKQQNAELQTAAEKSGALLASTRGVLSSAETALAEERLARRRLEGRVAPINGTYSRSKLRGIRDWFIIEYRYTIVVYSLNFKGFLTRPPLLFNFY